MPFFGILFFLLVSVAAVLLIFTGTWRYLKKGNPVILAAGICVTLFWGGCLWSSSRPRMVGAFEIGDVRIELRSKPGWDEDSFGATMIFNDGRSVDSELGFTPSSGVIEAYRSESQNALWLVINNAGWRSQTVYRISLSSGHCSWIGEVQFPGEIPRPADLKLVWSSYGVSSQEL